MSEDPYRRDPSAEPDAAGTPRPPSSSGDDVDGSSGAPVLDAPPGSGSRESAPAPAPAPAPPADSGTTPASGLAPATEPEPGDSGAAPAPGSVAIGPGDEAGEPADRSAGAAGEPGGQSVGPATGRHASPADAEPQETADAGAPPAATAASGAGAAVPAAATVPAAVATHDDAGPPTGESPGDTADDVGGPPPSGGVAEARGDDETRETGEAAAAPAGRRGRRGRILAVALAALLVLGVVALLVFFVPRLLGGDDDRRAEVIDAARENAIAITSYDHRSLEEDFDRARSRTTGEFTNEFTQTTETIGPAIQQFQGTAEGEVLGSAVESLEGDTAQVLLFVNQTVQNANAPEGRVERTRIRMTMTEVDGEWLISDVRLV
jgi:Mce-associated membrane protein